MKLIIIIISFIFGTLFGVSIRIKDDYRNAYTHGYHDGIDSCTRTLNSMMEDEDE